LTGTAVSAVPARVTIPNQGAMSDYVGPFDVSSKLTGEVHHVRFSHLWNAIATRHSDTVDTKFFVNGRGAIVALAHIGLVRFAAEAGRNLTDREASFIAAEYLRERLQEEDGRLVYDVSADEVLRLIQKLRFG
jgi:hypothetical protein